ncbi:MAG: nucleotide pyrophosphohydrolase [Planctomycetaceae bacterium]|nr:nucleotide pyrophosphohydrolase [Planctomycetaceae bacterium]
MSDAPNPPTPSSQPAPASHPTNPLPPLPPGLALTSPLTIAGFQRLIFDQYYANDSKRGTPPTFMWFVEELGELSTALMNNAPGKSPTPEQRANLEEEFADVLAWLATLANINGVDLARALEKYTVKGVTGVKN